MTTAPRPASSGAALTLAAVAGVGAAYVARDVLVPLALALLLVALLSPVVGWLAARRVPAPLGATIVVLGAIALLAGAGAALAPPLRGLAADVPKSVAAARAKLSRLQGPLGAPFAHLAPAPSGQQQPQQAPNASPNASPNTTPSEAPSGLSAVAGRAFGTTSSVLASAFETLLLALFVLAAGDAWRRRLDAAVRSPARRAQVVEATGRIRAAVARYLLATALINVAQGVVVALVAWLLHLPTPPLWGVLTFIAEFVPYLGGAALMVLLLVVGLATAGGARALIMPGAYLVITSTQNNLVSPIVYGRGLRLNPAAILLAVMIWWALWGVAGAFLAVPMLAALRILTDYVPLLRPVGPFLGDDT